MTTPILKKVSHSQMEIYTLFQQFIHQNLQSLLIGAKPWIKQDWLDQLGMKNPETTDELYDSLKL